MTTDDMIMNVQLLSLPTQNDIRLYLLNNPTDHNLS